MTKKKMFAKKEAVAEEEVKDAICPACGVAVSYRCRLCGATKSVNQVSGACIWMRNGRIVRGGAFKDERTAFIQTAEKWDVPRSQWPEKFRS